MAKKNSNKRLLRHHPFVIPVVTLMVLFFVSLVAVVSFNATTIGPADSRVVHVYVDGEKRTIPTRAKTVKDLLKRLDIKVGKDDVIEPKAKTEILEDDFTVNVYRARTVTIVNGRERTTVTSAKQSPRDVAEEIGIKLFPEDKVDVQVPEDVLKDGLATERYIVKRSVPVKLVLYGEGYEVRTHSDTVSQLLEEKEIDPDDVTVFPERDSRIKTNSVVYVTYAGKKIVSRAVSIPRTVKTVDDPSLPLGTTQVKEAGRAGKKLVLYEVDKKTKKRRVLKEVIAYAPIPRVEARGSAAPVATVTGSKVQWMRQAGIGSGQFVYVDHIIGRESGWNPASVSPNRCIGLGQRCNPQILIDACPNWQNDPVCQLKHFSAYANGRYGSWQGAYNFWQMNHWW